MSELIRNWLTYLTFGKVSRLLETLVGALVIGGASELGTLPKGVRGVTGGAIIFSCIIAVCWLGIQTGKRTLSPTLNHEAAAAAISLLHFLYVSLALIIVWLLREPITDLEIIIQEETFRVTALVAILTLAYVLSVNRTTNLSPEERESRQQLRSLAEQMNELRKEDSIEPGEVLEMMERLNESAENIPMSKFPDVNEIKYDLEKIHDNLGKLDPDSAREVISGNYVDEEHRLQKYSETIKRYQGIKEKINRV